MGVYSLAFYSQGRYTVIDFQKAFDTVSHEILSYKLQAAGISGNLHALIMNYLKDRTQYAEINGECSSTKHVRFGVPQGSLLGPKLYSLHVNDPHLYPLCDWGYFSRKHKVCTFVLSTYLELPFGPMFISACAYKNEGLQKTLLHQENRSIVIHCPFISSSHLINAHYKFQKLTGFPCLGVGKELPLLLLPP